MDNSPNTSSRDSSAQAASASSGRLDAAGSASAGFGTVSSSVNIGAGNAAGGARQTIDKVSATAHETVERLASRATSLADRLDEKTRRLADAPQRALAYSTQVVQDHPVQAVAGALLVGYVLGLLSASRLTSQR
jgi:ElaB/YqjD/DUF883 family membrane-anchored ribosome-binding protein